VIAEQAEIASIISAVYPLTRVYDEFFASQQTAYKPAKTRSRSYSDAADTKFVRRQCLDSLSTGAAIRVFYRLWQSASAKQQYVSIVLRADYGECQAPGSP